MVKHWSVFKYFYGMRAVSIETELCTYNEGRFSIQGNNYGI